MNFLGNRVSQVITLIIASAIVVVIAYYYIKDFAEYRYLKTECDQVTTGEVYTYAHSGRHSSTNTGVRFEVDGNVYHAWGTDGHFHNSGEIISVHYKSGDPSVCYSGNNPTRMSTLFAMLFIISGLLTMFACIKMLVRGEVIVGSGYNYTLEKRY